MFIKLIKRFVLSSFVLYGYNIIALNFNLVLPFNFITLFTIFFLGIPGFIALILFNIFIL